MEKTHNTEEHQIEVLDDILYSKYIIIQLKHT